MSGSRGKKRSRGEALKSASTPQKESPSKKDNQALTEEERKEYADFLETKISLEAELSALKANSEQQDSMKEIMDLLHEYNDIKDATQVVLGALANMRGVTVASLHEEFELPLKDEWIMFIALKLNVR